MKTTERNLWQEAVDSMCAISVNHRPLRTERFYEAWMKWMGCMRERGKLPGPYADVLHTHISKCTDWGEERAVAAIRRSIAENRDDLVEPGQTELRLLIGKQ